MAVYTLSFTVAANTITPDEVQMAGVFGDHQAAMLQFTIPPELTGHQFRIEIVDGSGAYDISELLDEKNGVVSYPVPRKWTAAGTASLRLVAVQEGAQGTETFCFHSAPAHLYFEERADGPQNQNILPTWQEIMTRAETIVSTVQQAYDEGKFKGEKGEPGPIGPQGERGEPGVTSYGELTPDQKKELTAEGTALCAAVAAGVVTIEQNNHTPLKFWVGTEAEYKRLSYEQKQNCFCLVSDDTTFETLCADVAQLKTHLAEEVAVCDAPTLAEAEVVAEALIQQKYKTLPDKTFARFCLNIKGSYTFYELYKTINGWGHMERIRYSSRWYRSVQGKEQGATEITYTFGTWQQFAAVQG